MKKVNTIGLLLMIILMLCSCGSSLKDSAKVVSKAIDILSSEKEEDSQKESSDKQIEEKEDNKKQDSLYSEVEYSENTSFETNDIEDESEVIETADSNDSTVSSESEVVVESVSAYDDIISDFERIIEFRLSDDFHIEWSEGNRIIYSDALKKALEGNKVSYQWTCMIVEPPLYDEDFNASGFGYILYDMNNDGIMELFLVGGNHTILAVFTLVNEEPVLLTAFWSRHRGVISEEGFLICNGSSGAADNTYYVYSLDLNGNLDLQYGTKSESNYSNESVPVNYYIIEDGDENLVSFEEYEEFRNSIRMEQRAFWLMKEVNPLVR